MQKVDYIVILTYIFLGILLFLGHFFSLTSQELINKGILIFGLIVPLLLYMSYFHRLRCKKVFAILLLFGIVQMIFYLSFNHHYEFRQPKGTALDPLSGLFNMLVCFYIVRFIYWRLFKQELFITAQPGLSTLDYREGRKIRGADFFFSFLGAMGTTLLTVFISKIFGQPF